MPTFHHWKTGDKKFGLTFQAAADARAFDKGVRTAVEDLLDGYADTSPLTSLQKCAKDVGDEDVFMALDLPQDPKDSRSSSDSSTKESENVHRIAYIGRDKPLESQPSILDPHKVGKEGGVPGGGGSGAVESYPYVQLTAVHEYIYPAEDPQKPPLMRRDSGSSVKKGGSNVMELNPQQQPPLPLKGVHKKIKIRCRYCHELYTEDKNPRGSCEYAPDLVKSCINRITCIGCAECIGYHCAADEEGDFAQHPCDCTGEENCTRRWCCLTFLSIFVPCLWLYPPLKLCHWCGIKCGVCGGRHGM
ncbi:unnamed protein product [Callosobruchus maculatus]|uniref:WH1 domain-containing protein n=1 Tax=Callosobruchus maculatus TaxID=64391 RepID=A0A653DUK4_CALMS|nr:unnamed protein product [Callosobruchus maculatus]